jgi:hypothetical protein
MSGRILIDCRRKDSISTASALAKAYLHRNALAIALANKLARIAWGVLARGRAFEASKLQAA